MFTQLGYNDIRIVIKKKKGMEENIINLRLLCPNKEIRFHSYNPVPLDCKVHEVHPKTFPFHFLSLFSTINEVDIFKMVNSSDNQRTGRNCSRILTTPF